MTLLEVSNLSVSYGTSRVVSDVSFEVNEGEIIGIVGANGAGKTSILDSIFNYTDWEGEIRVKGEDISSYSASEVANLGICYCMEEHNLFPYMSVRGNLLIGGSRHPEEIDVNIEYVFELFPRLEERMDQQASTLSGGERQMLAIGKALMADPDLLILDEPTLGLAPVIIENISDAIDELRERVSILLIEQNVTFSFEHADKIILLGTGEIVTQGSPEELEDDPHIQEAFFGI